MNVLELVFFLLISLCFLIGYLLIDVFNFGFQYQILRDVNTYVSVPPFITSKIEYLISRPSEPKVTQKASGEERSSSIFEEDLI